MASDKDYDYVEVNVRENPYSGDKEVKVVPHKYGEGLWTLISVTLLFIFIALLIQCGAGEDKRTYIYDDFSYNLSDDESYFILLGSNNTVSGDLVIPSEVNGKPIKVIDEKAFKDCNKMTSVIIPDSVTVIYFNAFQGCDSLKSVVIGNGVTVIGGRAFEGCDALKSVSIGNSVKYISGSAFKNCNSLVSINIPNRVTNIDSNAFAGCYRLKNINYNGTVEQWNAIVKDSNWSATTPNIHCTDGTIANDGTVTYTQN